MHVDDTQINGNYRLRNISFEENVGQSVSVTQDGKYYSFFKLYFTNDVIEKIAQETNIYMPSSTLQLMQLLYREGQC